MQRKVQAAYARTDYEEAKRALERLHWERMELHPSAARSLEEGMEEMFALQRLQIPPSLHKCLATTNIIESPQGGVERRAHNVTRWRDADMVEPCAASA